jgi:Cys-tRNA(Pro)/Cys-tRNA(Cys) deacylase
MMTDQTSTPEASPVSRVLSEVGIPHRVFHHPGPIESLEQAARERGQRPEQVIRSLLFRLGSDEFVMVLMAGPAQVPWPRLRSYLGQSRLTTATAEEVLAVTGFPLGAVSPFGLPDPLRIIGDESIFLEDEVSIGSGLRGTTIILSQPDLRRALGEIEIANLAGN